MLELRTDLLPAATKKNFARLHNDARLAIFSLVGGTALALQIGHRISEDLDFNIFGSKLPIRAINGVLNDLSASGAVVKSLITTEQKSRFKINTSESLDDYIQDYMIDGAKVTFHSRNETEIPRKQIDFLKSAHKLAVSDNGFTVLGVDGLFVMKSILTYDRVKSRDLYDLMILTRDNGYSIGDIFAAIDAYQPIRNKDPEHFKNVATGLVALDEDDEGFSSIHVSTKMGDIYEYFKKLINEYEIKIVQQLR